uniref:uncharacterized protein LOC122596185 n=1 Tax=Erigeron canadensis TaxID=72917 RepID=UPI001CB92FE0|nr:uncharacterized protein LOC122596185 [Erigeron canadensis]
MPDENVPPKSVNSESNETLIRLDDIYANVRSMILTTEPLPNVKTAFALISREESHRDSGANQHMTGSQKNMFNLVDISDLNLTVSHPNGTKAKITKIGNLRLSSNIVLFDVLVIPGYCVSLLSVHKLARVDLISKKTLWTGSCNGGLYVFDNMHVGNSFMSCNSFVCCISQSLWHSRLGHPADQVLYVLKDELKLKYDSEHGPCEVCHKAKQTREPFPLSDHKTKSLGELVHLDLWGPYRVTSRDGYKYFLTIVDDFSRAVWVFLLKSKDEVYENIVNFVSLIKNQFDKNIKCFRSDNGTEFINHRMLPSRVLAGKSPFELVYGFKPKLFHLRNFGCLCFATNVNLHDKFAQRSEKDVKFYEEIFPLKQKDKQFYETNNLDHANFFDLFSSENTTIISETPYDEGRVYSDNGEHKATPLGSSIGATSGGGTDANLNGDQNDIPEGNLFDENHINPNDFPADQANLRRSNRNVGMPIKYGDYVVEGKVKYGLERVVNYTHLSKENICFVSSLNKSVEPKSYKEACEIERYKARLVAKGYNQRTGLDFEETFAPVVKMVTVRCLLNLAVQNKWKLFQIDINNVFLYGNLNEDVYMDLPDGYFGKQDGKVCKLVKSLYGLKQAPRQWNEKLTLSLVDMEFIKSKSDYSLFTKNEKGVFLALLVYVDDIVVTGIEILKTENRICLSQRKYCLELLNEFGLLGCKPMKSPLEANCVL